ncbi:MAG TPA: hypothetical protein DEP05_05455 [Betaproteobacteria bacterium]|nr:hypothetical protein [Betaproteobacteria bacterium]
MDLYSRQVVGWSMLFRMRTDLVLKALLMAVWRRKPRPGLLIHSDQGSQYTGHEWRSFIKAHGLVCSMNCRGSCRELFPVAQARVYQAEDLCNAGQGAGRCLRLHRSLLQHSAPAWLQRRPVSGNV